MNTRNLARLAIFALLANCAIADEMDPTRLAIVRPDAIEWRDGEPSAVSNYNPVAGCFRADSPNAPTSTKGTEVLYRLTEASQGMTFMDIHAEWRLGDFLTDIPVDTDWAKTFDAIRATEAYSDGTVTIFPGMSNPAKRILFSRGGSVDIPWVSKADGSTNVTTYAVARASSKRPKRIFWTSAPYNAPGIDFSGKFIRLFGDPDIVNPVYEADPTAPGISNIVRGVYYDSTTKTLQAAARGGVGVPEDGPKGQFVVAYYDTGSFDNLVAITVAEASGPDVTTLNAHVGERLQPYSGGYDTEGLRAYIQKGAMREEGDLASPYLEVFAAKSKYNEKDGAVYAIAPNDETSTGTDSPAPWRADIYWETPDDMDTLWPFEEDWYNITWDQDDVKMIVSDDPKEPGIPLFLPTNYTVTVSAYMSPGGCAEKDETVNGNSIKVSTPGRFLLKLTFDDDVRYLAVNALSRDDPAVSTGNAVDKTVRTGDTLAPLSGNFAGEIADYAAMFGGSARGYIYRPASPAFNWNPHFYRDLEVTPLVPSVDIASADEEDGDIDYNPFESLESSICLVAPSPDPVEVWWYRQVEEGNGEESLPAPVMVPGVVFRYNCVLPEPGDTHEIAIVSQKGSAMPSGADSGVALFLADENAGAWSYDNSLNAETAGIGGDPFALGLWVQPSPSGRGAPPALPGRLAAASFASGDLTAEFNGVAGDAPGVEVKITSRDDVSGSPAIWQTVVSAASGRWTHLALAFGAYTNGCRAARLYVDGEEVHSFEVLRGAESGGEPLPQSLGAIGVGKNPDDSAPAAAGWAVDELTLWKGDVDAAVLVSLRLDNGRAAERERMEALRFHGDFVIGGETFELRDDETDLEHYIMSATYQGAIKTLGAVLWLQPGAPTLSQETLAVSSGISPRVYRQTNEMEPGYRLNLEHAFVDDCTVWAIRNDLREGGEDNAFVLVEYARDGRGAMAVYNVVVSNAVYNAAETDVVVATQMLPPYPLRLVDGYWNRWTTYEDAPIPGDSDNAIHFRDRKLNDWARRDGETTASYAYKLLNTFDLPGIDVPGLHDNFIEWPYKWLWHSSWPANAPVMQVAQTLTKAVNGLPEVWNMASCQVVFPATNRVGDIVSPDGTVHTGQRTEIVDLIDPVTAQTAPLPIQAQFAPEYGFRVGPSGTASLRMGKYYFTGLPPRISDRFYVDANAAEAERMVLVGELAEPATGNAYLRLNTLTPDDVAVLKSICILPEGSEGKTAWDAAVDVLAAKPSPRPGPDDPAANYALVANGDGAGFVVIAENNSSDTDIVPEGEPINLQVVCVTNTLYAGAVSTQSDPLNKLSELLTVQYNDDFGPSTTNFVFQWQRHTPLEDGSVPGDGVFGDLLFRYGDGLTSFLVGTNGTQLTELVNMYYRMRYRPKDGTPAAYTCGTDFSGWTGVALAEGWIQRVLNSVTPFAQRVEDFYSNPSDIAYTMLEQIGRPYQGDVALNNDNLDEIGLLELYRTVFNKAWKMSLALGVRDADVDKQLLLAASRIADFYQLLGSEAYADAKNPLIAHGLNDTYVAELGSIPSSTFCFQNQVRTLLDEELALLRGRAASTDAPNMTTQPCFNRLYWNLTKGITEGEVAYVNNYGIRASDGVLGVDQAAAQYPQGHGDAWGHYLSSLSLYYRLLANENFDWHATMSEMNLSQTVANVDYYDEQKFADSAVKLAQIGLDTLDLSARKAWRDNGGDMLSGHDDADPGQAFGYGEWAVRSGLGGIYDWAAANAMLPAAPAGGDGNHADAGISRIDRGTVTQLAELCSLVDEIQRRVNTLNGGLNPLGLSQNTIPMDIDPAALAERGSHFDQILERAEKALANCQTVLDFANKYGGRLQQIANAETTAAARQAETEAEFNRELIAIYGTPFPGDIGTGKLYGQGYEGPDLYHYMYMDLAEFGLEKKAPATTFTKTYTKYTVESAASGVAGDSTVTVEYSVSPDGIVLMPDGYGVRAAEGSIQTAYRAFLSAYVAAKAADAKYEHKVAVMNTMVDRYHSLYATKQTALTASIAEYDALKAIKLINIATKKSVEVAGYVQEQIDNSLRSFIESTPKVVGAGLTIVTDPSAIAAAATAGILTANDIAEKAAKTTQAVSESALSVTETICDLLIKNYQFAVDTWQNKVTTEDTYWAFVNEVKAATKEAQAAIGALSTAEAAYRAEVAKGDLLLAERERVRKAQSNTATQYRYQDMFERVQRNNALTKYSTAFDTAQRYVWELAKVYDYETGLLASDRDSGDRFLAEIVGSRQLGWPGVSTSQATDKGLYDIVNRMKENWAVLKGRLGVNNPDASVTEFSLRYELFRIKPDASGDEAWRRELRKYWVDDLNADPDFRRLCQPLASTSGAAAKEPGLVIPFATATNAAENFFGKTLQGGDHAFSSADYATKVFAVGVSFEGYDALAGRTVDGLAANPNVYLVPAGLDYMRAPSANGRAVLSWNVVDQVLPLPYTIGSTELDDPDWVSTFEGTDGTSDSVAKIRRHSTLRADGGIYSTRLVGRSVWNGRWLLVIPAASLNANREAALETFINGVGDIRLGLQAYARSGN